MDIRTIIEKHIRGRSRGVNAAADVHAVVASNAGSKTHVSSRSRHRLVQRGGRKIVDEHDHETGVGGAAKRRDADHH